MCLNFVLPSTECEQSLADFLAHNAAELNVVLIRAASLRVLLLEPREGAQFYYPPNSPRFNRPPNEAFVAIGNVEQSCPLTLTYSDTINAFFHGLLLFNYKDNSCP